MSVRGDRITHTRACAHANPVHYVTLRRHNGFMNALPVLFKTQQWQFMRPTLPEDNVWAIIITCVLKLLLVALPIYLRPAQNRFFRHTTYITLCLFPFISANHVMHPRDQQVVKPLCIEICTTNSAPPAFFACIQKLNALLTGIHQTFVS